MSHTIDYSKYDHDPELKKQKALHDIKFWLNDRYEKIEGVLKTEIAKGTDRQGLLMSIELFLGIQGYPAHIWLDELGCPQQTPISTSGTAQTQAGNPEVG